MVVCAPNGIYRERVPKGTKLAFTPAWRRTFGVLGKAVGWGELETLATVANVRTFQRWYKLVQEAPAQLANTVGRPKVPAWVEMLVLTMAYTTTCGITRIAGAVANVWQKIRPKTVRRVLREHRALLRPHATHVDQAGEHLEAVHHRGGPPDRDHGRPARNACAGCAASASVDGNEPCENT